MRKAVALLATIAVPGLAGAQTDPSPHAHQHGLPAPEGATLPAAGHSGGATAPVAGGALSIDRGFARAMLPGARVGSGYLTITNRGTEDDRLVSVASPSAGTVAVHSMTMEGDVMRMRQVEDGIEIPAGKAVTLAPGGLHLMFEDVATPFRRDTSVPVTLTFEKAGSVEVALPVAAPDARRPDDGG